MDINIPPVLAEIAAGRDHIKTAEFARAFCKADQTIRKNYCLTGECYGIRPVKVGNHLLWSVCEAADVLNGVLIRTSKKSARTPVPLTTSVYSGKNAFGCIEILSIETGVKK